MYDIEMALDIYTGPEPISIEPITYEELWYIRRYLNTDTNGAGNTIILPMNSQWQQLFEKNRKYINRFDRIYEDMLFASSDLFVVFLYKLNIFVFYKR